MNDRLLWYADTLEPAVVLPSASQFYESEDMGWNLPFLDLIAVASSIRTSKGWGHLVLKVAQRGR